MSDILEKISKDMYEQYLLEHPDIEQTKWEDLDPLLREMYKSVVHEQLIGEVDKP